MNRASLLHILDHAGGISEAEVRELEQLAAAFPYCQTAHLLLAKAAYDSGSMLAGQRLRRAATYAADRELLRALIEQPAPVATPERATTPPAGPASAPPSAPAELTPSPPEPAQPATTAPEGPAELPQAAAVTTLPGALAEEPATAQDPAAAAAKPAAPEEAAPETAPAQPLEAPEAHGSAAAAPASTVAETSVEPAQPGEVAAAQPEPSAEPQATPAPEPAEPAGPPAPVAHIPDEPADEPLAAAILAAAATSTGLAGETVGAALPLAGAILPDLPSAPAEALPADELPPAAPLIRPPVEAGSSRFEFGLGDTPEPEPAYQLPEPPAASHTVSIPPYRADEFLAYALPAGSRLGAALTLREAGLTHDLPVAADWHPDAPLLAHLAAHRPAAPALPSSLALIDKFLRSQPRIKSTARPAPTDAPQADLSVRSTSAAPSLASESLAKIMVKQGKTGRAIEIYEQLMQRQPEKKAYFAAQIDLLNQQPE